MEVNFKKTDKILIVSPHQDDETFGCGGLLCKYGKQCDVLLLTNGAEGISKKYSDKTKLIDIRNKEITRALDIVKINKFYHLNIEDGKVNKNKRKIRTFNIKNYNYIFVPNGNETHSDHKCVLSIFRRMKLLQKSKAQIYEYEVWTPLRCPTFILDISKYMNTKMKMINCYKSQLADRDYRNALIGLNQYRGIFINTKYGEAYKNSNYIDIFGNVYEILPERLKNFIIKVINK